MPTNVYYTFRAGHLTLDVDISLINMVCGPVLWAAINNC